jgi:EmrB/QacA subfamily drug resistance transporter
VHQRKNESHGAITGTGVKKTPSAEVVINRKSRFYIITAALLTIFLASLDALVMAAAMPTIVTDLGGLHLYSWVFSAYLLSRAVSLPVFGKLSDQLPAKKLFNISIILFITGSVLAGAAQSMLQLIVFRALQGIGAGGNFALAYTVLADISSPEKRGKMMAMASFVWGVSSVLGPTFGGFMVSYFSWRWIFFINVPLGSISLFGISLYLIEIREKRSDSSIDYLGALTLSVTIVTLLTAFLLAGRGYNWLSPQIIGFFAITGASAVAFFYAEKRAPHPIMPLRFFNLRGFRSGNGSAFFSSFAIFSLFAFSPLFIQGALGKTPAQVGLAMMPLSIGWSVGALLCGQLVYRFQEKPYALLGAFFMVSASALTLTFSPASSLMACSITLALSGLGMGLVSMATLLIVQNSLDASDLGVATTSHQFARTLGGTMGIGIAGSLATARITAFIEVLLDSGLREKVPPHLLHQIQQNAENLFRPDVQALLAADINQSLHEAVGRGVMVVFGAALLASFICLVCSFRLPRRPKSIHCDED